MPSMKGLGPVSFQGNAVPMPKKVRVLVHQGEVVSRYSKSITQRTVQAAREEIVSLTVKSKDAESDTDQGERLHSTGLLYTLREG